MFVKFVWTKNSLYGRSGNRGYFFTIKSNVEQPNFIVFGAFPTFFADSMNDSLPESGCNHFRAISLPLFGASDHTGFSVYPRWSRALCNHNIHWFASKKMQLSLAFTCAGLDRQMFIWRGGGDFQITIYFECLKWCVLIRLHKFEKSNQEIASQCYWKWCVLNIRLHEIADEKAIKRLFHTLLKMVRPKY